MAYKRWLRPKGVLLLGFRKKKSEGFHKLKYMKGYIRSVKRAKRANDALYDCKGSRRNVLVLPD